MWRRWEVPPRSSWIQRIGFWPLNVMSRRMARTRSSAVATSLNRSMDRPIPA